MRGILLRSIGALVALLIATGAQSAVIITAVETAGDVVFSTEAGGSLDLSGLTAAGSSSGLTAVIAPFEPFMSIGSTSSDPTNRYSGVSLPSLGSGGVTNATSGSGPKIGVDNIGRLHVPFGYVSNTILMVSTSTYTGETFASLGLTEGTHVWSWSSDSITLNVGAPVPIPAAAWLFGSAIGLLGWMRRRAA